MSLWPEAVPVEQESMEIPPVWAAVVELAAIDPALCPLSPQGHTQSPSAVEVPRACSAPSPRQLAVEEDQPSMEVLAVPGEAAQIPKQVVLETPHRRHHHKATMVAQAGQIPQFP
jgi:hypothetical protein